MNNLSIECQSVASEDFLRKELGDYRRYADLSEFLPKPLLLSRTHVHKINELENNNVRRSSNSQKN
jgi:hypothetical protein